MTTFHSVSRMILIITQSGFNYLQIEIKYSLHIFIYKTPLFFKPTPIKGLELQQGGSEKSTKGGENSLILAKNKTHCTRLFAMSRWDDVQTTLDESWWWLYLKLAKWTFIMSTPVMLLTISGTLVTICSTSPVNLAAPISPWPDDTIVIFLACERGAATSAAICYKTHTALNHITCMDTTVIHNVHYHSKV